MKLKLRTSLGSLYEALLVVDEPCNIVRLSDFVCEWESLHIQVSKIATQTRLRLHFATGMTAQEFITRVSLGLPELLNCDSLLIHGPDGTYSAAKVRNLLEPKNTSTWVEFSHDDTAPNPRGLTITLNGFGGATVLARLTIPGIVEALVKRTTLVAGLPPTADRTISFEVLANRRQESIKNRHSVLVEELRKQNVAFFETKPTMLSPTGPKVASIIFASAHEWTSGEWSFVSGGHVVFLPRSSDLEALRKRIVTTFSNINRASSKFIGYRITVEFPNASFNEQFVLIPDSIYVSQLDLLDKWLSAGLPFGDVQRVKKRAVLLALELAASKLSVRKQQLESAARVLVGNRLMFQVPKSEQETVILFAKLEAIGATPLHYIKLLEMSPSGIDSIADIQVFQHEPVTKYGLIEFEPRFSQFVAHGHPVDHVDLIVCWEVDGIWKDKLGKTKYPWLFTYKGQGREVRAISLSGFPDVRITEARR